MSDTTFKQDVMGIIDTLQATAQGGFTTWMGIIMFWIPVIVCALYYLGDNVRKYRIDVEARSAPSTFYRPELTVGRILGTFLLCVIPGINLFMTVFHTGPYFLKGVFTWLGNTLDFALVPDSDKHRQARTTAATEKREKELLAQAEANRRTQERNAGNRNVHNY